MRNRMILKTDSEDSYRQTLKRLGELKVAVVHDWLIAYGGAERVLEQILQVVPQADLFALYDFTPEHKRGYFLDKPVTTSFLQKFPMAKTKYRSYLPFMPMAVEQFDLSGYDVVISSSHAVAHGVLTNSEQLHISYFNNTMVYAWDLYHHYLHSAGLNKGLRGMLAKAIMHYIRSWDAASAPRVDAYIANSQYMAGRIRKLYGKPSTVIYPPVDVDEFDLCEDREDFYVTVSRLVPFKRIDIIVDAFTKMPNKRLVVIGDGPEMARLQKAAGSNISFLGFRNREVVNDYIKRARAFLFSSAEPFGIAVVEAQACGTPIIAYGRGAAPEIVRDGETGLLFDRQTADGLSQAIDDFEQIRGRFDPAAIAESARRFSSQKFRRRFAEFVAGATDSFFGGEDVTPMGKNFSTRAENLPEILV